MTIPRGLNGNLTRLDRAAGLVCVAIGLMGSMGFGPVRVGAQQAEAHLCPVFDKAIGEPMEAVHYLAADDLEGRFSGSAGARCAADYIAAHFEELGLEPAGDDGFFQDFPLQSAVLPHGPAGTGRNVIALLPGSGVAADVGVGAGAVIIGAHYDHLGRGEFGSLGTVGEIHNGADDNASGVAALIEVARLLVADPAMHHSVLFVAFSGEELGLIGSTWYTRNPVFPLEKTVAMINLDMVGRLESDELIVSGVGTASQWREILAAANTSLDIPMAYEEGGYGPSDHAAFYTNDVPVLHFFTNAHEDYHRPSDDPDRVDADGLSAVSRLTARTAALVAKTPGRIAVVTGVGQPPSTRSSGSGAWLGTVPDYAPAEHGVRLSGVQGGSPAANAGMTGGDVLIAFGGEEIADLQAFSNALNRHSPGDEVEIAWLRDGVEHSAKVILGDTARRPQ